MKTTAAALFVLAVAATHAAAATVYQDTVLSHNPVLYWSFDEPGDTDNARSLVNDVPENELVARGAASRGPSTTTAGGASLGRAAIFDPSVDPQSRFNAANLSPVDPLTTFAVELWFNLDTTADRYLSETFSEAAVANQPGLIYNFNAGEFELFAGGRTGTVVTPNQWHHVVAAFYGPGNGVEIYVDGALAPNTDRNGGFSQVHSFGQFALGNTVLNPQAINGSIDEYAIYDLGGFAEVSARQAHVAAIAQHHAIVPEPGTAALAAFGLGALVMTRRRRTSPAPARA